jgi:hypothetical protein
LIDETNRDDVALLIQPASVTQTFAVLAVRGAGKTNAARVMAESMFDLKLPFVAVDPVGSWWGLRASRDGATPGLPIPVFGGRHGDMPLDLSAAVLLADLIVEKRLSCVLDLSTFPSESEKKKFLLYFAQRLYQNNQDPLHLFLEEADDYIPQKPFREEAQLLRAWENIVRRGRARGLGMTMITQRSAKINKDVLTQVETLIAMRTTSPQDRAAVEAWVKYHSAKAEILESLPSLQDGEAWIWSPHFLGDTFRMRFPLSRTFDSGATPKNVRSGESRAPATMADIDLGELRKKMEATLIKVKESDPKELKKEIDRFKLEAHVFKTRAENAEKAAHAAQRKQTVVPDQAVIDKATARVEKTWRNRILASLTQLEQHVKHLRKQLADVGHELTALDSVVIGFNLTSALSDDVVRPAALERLYPPEGKSTLPQYPKKVAQVSRMKVQGSGPCDSELTPSLRRVLKALAQYPDGMETNRLAALSGYTVNGHFNNMVGTLRTKEYITPARVVPIQITDAGLNALGQFEPLPVGAELRQYWLNKVGSSKAKILQVLFDDYPEGNQASELAAKAGYTVNGHFNNMIGSLRTMGLITPPRQPIKAMGCLFEE